ncbi:MAG: hypothetical protein FJX25_18110 [Alphaproteobacteria bacterium]|nr:hypothetical protein [Alphaproteobacteria bacterium]
MTDDRKAQQQDPPRQVAGETSAWDLTRATLLKRLEEAASQECELFDEAAKPYTAEEQKEAEALRAEVDRPAARAEAFNRQVTERLTRESEDDARKTEQLKRFQKIRGLKLELAAF